MFRLADAHMQKISKMGELLLLAVACLTIMVGCVIVPGLPTVAARLGVSSAASWLVTIPSLGVVLLGPLAGRLISRFGLYKALCGGLFTYGLLGAGGVFLQGMVPVFADRLLLGGATAVVMASGTGLISEFYSGSARLGIIAKQGMAIELGGVIFLALGGWLASVYWYLPFSIYLVAWVLLLLVLRYVPDPTSHADGPAEKGAIGIPLPFALKVVYGAALCSMIAFFTGIIVLPFRLNELAVSEAQTGYFLAFVSLIAVGAAAAMPALARAIGEYRTLCAAFLFYSLAHLTFCLAGTVAIMVAGGIAMGIGFGLSIPLVNHMVIEQSHARQRGKHLAYLSMAIFCGQFLSSFMEFIPGDRTSIFAAAALIALTAAIAVWRLHARAKAH
jgi:MFS family permease